jgi:probable HAF family extracellular repeat protein
MRTVSSVLVVLAFAIQWGCHHDQDASFDPRIARAALIASGARYSIAYLPTLGGSRNRPSGISNSGLIAGFVNRPGNATRVAAFWRGSSLDTLGTLGGPNSIVQWPGVSNNGFVVGITETADLDPLHEQWSCTAFLPSVTGHICLGFVWKDGVMKPLPTLGGYQGFAAGVNPSGQVVGWAETIVHDPTCNAPQVLQFRAVLWDTKKDTLRQLRPLPGDSTSAATAINPAGQVVGISGDCDVAVGQLSARHSVLWQNGVPENIGDLGGDAWHTPMDINEAGDVVGFSNPAGVVGIDFAPHAFVWTRSDGIRDLGALSGDAVSQGLGINKWRQVVGVSSGVSNRAFLWENGEMKDLNGLVGSGFPDLLIVAQHINDAGVIVGRAVLHGRNIQIPFVATPISEP